MLTGDALAFNRLHELLKIDYTEIRGAHCRQRTRDADAWMAMKQASDQRNVAGVDRGREAVTLERQVAKQPRLPSNSRSRSSGGRKETKRGNRGSLLWLVTLCKGTRIQAKKV